MLTLSSIHSKNADMPINGLACNILNTSFGEYCYEIEADLNDIDSLHALLDDYTKLLHECLDAIIIKQ